MSTLEHYLKTDVHAYFVSVQPKALMETLCIAEAAIQSQAEQYPNDRHEHHLSVIRELMRECERQRPTGSDGKHGDLHTLECGCDR